MPIVPLSDIEIRRRQRRTIETKPLQELRDSIQERGLMHPPVCWYDTSTSKWVLTAGERRLTAINQLADMKVPVRVGQTECPVGTILVTPLPEAISEIMRFELELDENLRRVDLPWQDRCQALADLHDMRKIQNPTQTYAETGRELVESGMKSTRTGEDLDESAAAKQVRRAVIVSQHIHRAAVQNARNENEALQIIYKREEEAALAALARRQTRASTTVSLEVRHDDLLIALPKLPESTWDLVCADPPYGLGADSAGYRARTVQHHNYDDSLGGAQEIYKCILTEGFRITRPRANIFLFCDINLFDWLQRLSANMGWVPFRRPLIWQKSESEGLAPWGGSGPRLTTELIFYATKGQRGMNNSPTDVFNVKRVPRNERVHAAEKPVELMRRLIECTTLTGESVIDPCCGSGSTLVACRELKRSCLGIEKSQEYYDTAMANLYMKDAANGV